MRLRCARALLAALAVVTIGPLAAWASASGSHPTRSWHERVLAPAQFDFSLAELSFVGPGRAAHPAAGGARRAASLRLAVRGASGLDYVAGAVTRFTVRRRPRALVLVVNRRPRGSLAPDIARIGIAVTAPSRLGRPILWQIANPLSHPSALTPALCDLPVRGAALAAGELRAVLSRGRALPGFSAAAALAQAYNLVCRRPYARAFVQAVTAGSTPPCEAAQPSVPCCPPNATCLPPPCPPCPPCGPGPCVAGVAPLREALIPCPLASPPIACPL